MLAAAVALPFVIEATQLLVPSLGRACESADVVDNLTGLVLGLAAGAVVARFAPTLGRPSEPGGKVPARPAPHASGSSRRSDPAYGNGR